MAHNHAFDHGIPSEIDVQSADQLRSILAASITSSSVDHTFDVALPGQAPVSIALTHGVAQTLLDLLRLIASQRGFYVIPYGAELSTQEAADILNVSRPHLIKLVDAGEIKCEKVGRHRRIKSHDLFAYKSKRDDERSSSLDEMAKVDSELGLI
ncbi:helix-turn-helix domain-containing protein [Tateyamaria sp.]|uniref:helix-turn-helix domain-containing protein n=1 Tax=Tateyamaria sp. TaxID=1929288 RepID=UPI003B210E4C